jgi:hypothetical protein
MGQMTQARIAAWQKAAGIKPAIGGYGAALRDLSNAAFEAIKVIELEQSGIRDGDGCWHGSDVIGRVTGALISLCWRVMAASDDDLPDGDGGGEPADVGF